MEFDRKIAGYLSKNFQQGCEKNLQQVQKNIWGRWFNVNFKCFCLFLYFEQDSFRHPARNILKQCCNCNQFFQRILLKKNSCSTNTGSFLRWLSKNFLTFNANVSAGLLQLHSTCQEQHSEAKCNFLKSFSFRAPFFRFWAKNLRPFVRKVSEVLSKIPSLYG